MNDTLRSRAEAAARQQADEWAMLDAASPEVSRLLHDLRVHQIELEMQNEELRRAQEALERSRARYFDLYDLAPVGYCTIGISGLIVEANLAAATLLGATRSALVGHPLSRFIVAEDQDAYYLHRKRLLATGVPQVLELRLRRGDGGELWTRLEAATTRDGDGGERGVRLVLSDIGERKRIEEERLRFERELQQAQKVESLARMAGAIAHHFNNQLAVVLTNLEMCRETLGSHQAAPFLTDAVDATTSAANVSGLLLTYLGQSSGNHAPLDFAETCRQTLPLLRAAAPDRVTFDTHLPEPGPSVNGNAHQLQVLLTNVVTNAWESIGEVAGTVALRLTVVGVETIPRADQFATAWTPRAPTYACLEVTDTGCGVDPDDIDKIFDPFFTTKFIGRGLGLPVVLGILHAHDGGLTLESRTGHESGSVVRIYLPVSPESVAPRPAASGAIPTANEVSWSGTALLVENEDALRAIMTRALVRLGFTVIAARDGVEALDAFRRHVGTIRFVLCDLSMPHMDGWETLAALRAVSPDLPAILTSGYDEAEVMAHEHQERPQAFLPKPYSLHTLQAAIRHTLRSAGGNK